MRQKITFKLIPRDSVVVVAINVIEYFLERSSGRFLSDFLSQVQVFRNGRVTAQCYNEISHVHLLQVVSVHSIKDLAALGQVHCCGGGGA